MVECNMFFMKHERTKSHSFCDLLVKREITLKIANISMQTFSLHRVLTTPYQKILLVIGPKLQIRVDYLQPIVKT